LKPSPTGELAGEIEKLQAFAEAQGTLRLDAAKDKQGVIEAHIADIEDKLARAEVIDPSKLSGDRVRFGAVVLLTNLDTDEESTYQIVGADEADLKNGTISVSAPLSRALIGKSTGDEVVVTLPGGTRRYEIGSIEFR